MTTTDAKLVPIEIALGVQPTTDRTRLNTQHYTFADKVRFWNGSPQKIGGWQSVLFNGNKTIEGYARTLYSTVLQSRNVTVVGTNENVYAIYASELTNITPLDTDTTAIANSLSTDYGLLETDPFIAISGSNIVSILVANSERFVSGDRITISGAIGFAGISTGSLNGIHKIRSVGSTFVTILVADTASSGSPGGDILLEDESVLLGEDGLAILLEYGIRGGGSAVVLSSGLITVTASGMEDGKRVKISGAADTGGILASEINAEFISRNSTATTFDVMTIGYATSSVTSGGGASTVYQIQISSGDVNESLGQGWGVGRWGVGRWGVPQVSASGISYPRIWIMDRFGDSVMMTPGNQSGVYYWKGNIEEAPVLVTNAPTDVNYMFVSNNILVTFGHGDIPNQIFASDQGDPTEWTASSLNQVYQDIIEGADRLVSHVPVLGVNLIFTPHQTYKFEKVDINAGVWSITLLDNSIGIIAPLARVSVNDTAFWMARNNFYMWSGGNIQIIPANDQEQCTALNYVFQNINTSQLSKCFGWYNPVYHEVWFHYPSEASLECDRVIRVSLIDNNWTMDTFDRTCAEYPSCMFGYPRMISSSGVLYNHETGNDADGQPMSWTLTSNLRNSGKQMAAIPGVVPDSIQTGDISVNIKGYLFPQSATPCMDNTYTVSPTTERIISQGMVRFWDYTISGNSLGQYWNMGQWFEYVQAGANN